MREDLFIPVEGLMCTSRPYKVLRVDFVTSTAIVVDSEGNERSASLIVVGKVVAPGNFVYLRGDYVTHVLTPIDIAAICRVYPDNRVFFSQSTAAGQGGSNAPIADGVRAS